MGGQRAIATDEAMRVITAALVPYVGRTMAEASLRMHCERLGIHGNGTLAAADVDRLMQRLGGALSVFVGPQTTDTLLASIRRELQPESAE
jgi:hypothetical protein